MKHRLTLSALAGLTRLCNARAQVCRETSQGTPIRPDYSKVRPRMRLCMTDICSKLIVSLAHVNNRRRQTANSNDIQMDLVLLLVLAVLLWLHDSLRATATMC
jgi:hypothetical protein